jgi:hypothetical protein
MCGCTCTPVQLATVEGEGKEGKTEMPQMLNKLPYQEREKIDVFHPVIFLLSFVMKNKGIT